MTPVNDAPIIGGETARIVIEAGDLKKSAPLRAFCEKAPSVAVISCYPDDAAAIGRLTDAELRAAHPLLSAEVARRLTVEESVQNRQSYGGTAPTQVRAQVARWKELLP